MALALRDTIPCPLFLVDECLAADYPQSRVLDSSALSIWFQRLQALECLNDLKDCEAKRSLEMMVDYVLKRIS